MSFHFRGKASAHRYRKGPFVGYDNVIAVHVLFVQRRANEGFGNSNLSSGRNALGETKNAYLANLCKTHENRQVRMSNKHEFDYSYPKLTPRAISVPQTQSSVPIRLLQLCALPPAANGDLGSAAQSPPKLFVYVNDVPSSNVILLPDPPEVEASVLAVGELLLTEELLFFFLTMRATGMAIAAAIKTRADRAISKIFLLRDVLTFGAWRLGVR